MQPTTPSEPDFWADDPDDLTLHIANPAMRQAALETTRLAIARWTGGIHRPRMLEIGSLHVSPQARWYAKTCEGFEKWREGGGFAQDERRCEPDRHEASHLRGIEIDNQDACVD